MKIVYDPTDLSGKTNNSNIDYIPNGETEQERAASFHAFSDLVTRELHLRKLSLLGNLEDRRRRLRAFLATSNGAHSSGSCKRARGKGECINTDNAGHPLHYASRKQGR